ncbi:hypothetical protein [Mixta mediterraneensis]|uniref:hypothetical protein n=1 Tax=Mixta mediterraneensis TaxID=2758443 RepID=UPI0018762EF7|nr:hypothetical protein [Mixta mediterraneensis]MBE5254498.1 hypothetical protein [Mixta mediterraneensis]
MTPRFTPHPPWAFRTVFLACLISLPLMGLIARDSMDQRQLTVETQQMQHKLQMQQRVLHALREAQHRLMQRMRQQQSSPPVLAMLDGIANALQPQIAIRSVEVDRHQQQVRLLVDASSFDALLAFNQRLETLPAKVLLENHRKTAEKNAPLPVNAAIQVNFQQEAEHEAAR